MPIYEYECDEHGGFELSRPMLEARSPGACPDCGLTARRLLSAPAVPLMTNGNRKAHAINERSRFEPRLERRETNAAPPAQRLQPTHGRPWAIGH